MRGPAGNRLLRLLGVSCATAGFLAWMALAWTAFSDPDRATPQGDEGGRLLGWGLTGTVGMIVGMLLLHVAVQASESDGRDDDPPPD